MNRDVEADLTEINAITNTWVWDDLPRSRPRTARRTYISKVPAALNCLNRYAKQVFDADDLYELKFRVMLICARLGWARDCSDGEGYKVDQYMFHLPDPGVDCGLGNAVEHRNLDREKIDDIDRAVAILQQFVDVHPLTDDEAGLLDEYRANREQERLAYERRCARRAGLDDYEEDEADEDDDYDDYGDYTDDDDDQEVMR